VTQEVKHWLKSWEKSKYNLEMPTGACGEWDIKEWHLFAS